MIIKDFNRTSLVDETGVITCININRSGTYHRSSLAQHKHIIEQALHSRKFQESYANTANHI